MGKQVVQDVLNKFSYLNKKEHETFAERKRLQRKVETDEEKERRQKQDREYRKNICSSQSDVEKKVYRNKTVKI